MTHSVDTTINLVADIGGTNIRIGLLANADKNGDKSAEKPGDDTNNSNVNDVTHLHVYQCNQYVSLADVIKTYIIENNIQNKVINACFAIACPVENDLISMTNLPWEFSKSALKKSLKLNKLLMINDYTAIAHAIPFLKDDQKVKIGGGKVIANKPISICGPGTGLGVANLIPQLSASDQLTGSDQSNTCSWISCGGEGGHVDFAPTDETEIAILTYLLTKYDHVSYEQLLSGLGLEQIYQAISSSQGDKVLELTAKEISQNALDKNCEVCQQALAQFCKTLGSFAGNLALTMASSGGVYIAGGIVPRFIQFLEESEFRQQFEQKGRFADFNRNIPTFVITEPQPGIIGAAAYLRQHSLKPIHTDLKNSEEL